MQGRFEFDGAEVLALLEESAGADEREFTEAQRFLGAGVDLHGDADTWIDEVEYPETGAAPGLWLMNDRGVYLRSNARKGGEVRAHAAGYRAEVPVGDERVCEFIDGAPLRQLLPTDILVLTVDEDRIGISLVRPS